MFGVVCFPYRFVVGFDEEQFFRRMNLEAASGNNVLQLLLLKVNKIVSMLTKLHLTWIKDERFNM